MTDPTAIYFRKAEEGLVPEILCNDSLTVVRVDDAVVYVFGYILAPWFQNEATRADYFASVSVCEIDICSLDGLFSIAVHELMSDRLLCFANKAGGARLHVRSSAEGFLLAMTPSNSDAVNTSALEEIICFRWLSGRQSIVEDWIVLQPGDKWEFTPLGQPQLSTQSCLQFVKDKGLTDIGEAVSETQSALTSAIQRQIPADASVAILLSGGVDSSVLAAIAAPLFKKFTAVSHQGTLFPNPELSTARTFAQEIGVHHEIVTFDDDNVAEALHTATVICGQPLRNQSSVILFRLLEHLKGRFDYVIYGEAADTLFGSSAIARYRERRRKSLYLKGVLKYLPMLDRALTYLPEKHRLRHLSEFDLVRHQIDCDAICYSEDLVDNPFSSDPKQIESLRALARSEADIEDESHLCHLAKVDRLRTDVANHLHETGSIARYFQLKVATPFMDARVVKIAEILADELYYGTTHVKPVLRAIGEEFFSKELMYLQKWGFPAPYRQWLEGPLNLSWRDSATFFRTSVKNSYSDEYKWTLIGLHILASNLDIDLSLPLKP